MQDIAPTLLPAVAIPAWLWDWNSEQPKTAMRTSFLFIWLKFLNRYDKPFVASWVYEYTMAPLDHTRNSGCRLRPRQLLSMRHYELEMHAGLCSDSRQLAAWYAASFNIAQFMSRSKACIGPMAAPWGEASQRLCPWLPAGTFPQGVN